MKIATTIAPPLLRPVPDAPGIGIEIDRRVLERFEVRA